MENNRDFKGVWIPKDVWLDSRLNALEKVILTEIDSLDMGENGCYASNKYISEFCQCSESKVSTAISKLIKLGYLYVHSFDGRKRVLKSCLLNFKRQDMKNCKSDYETLKYNNIANNTDNNSIKESKQESKKESKKGSFYLIISEYARGDQEVEELLGEWLKVRKAKRAAMTDKAIELNLKKLDSLAMESNMSVPDYLREVICRGWQAFYPINNNKYSKSERSSNIFAEIGRERGIF